MLPVLRVIVDSEEALHINVGQQPVTSTNLHFWVTTCLNEYETHCCTVLISLQCSDSTLDINLTCLFKEPVLLFSPTSFNPGYRDKPLITGASIKPYMHMQTQNAQSSWVSHGRVQYEHKPSIFSTFKLKMLSYLNSEGVVTSESGSNKKCFWLTVPFWVSMVTTGKPICRIQRFMMSSTELGSFMPDLLTA